MARFEMLYRQKRPGLDSVIEADTFRTSGKFFEFIVDKEIVRTLLMDQVIQIRRMDDDEEDDAEEGK